MTSIPSLCWTVCYFLNDDHSKCQKSQMLLCIAVGKDTVTSRGKTHTTSAVDSVHH